MGAGERSGSRLATAAPRARPGMLAFLWPASPMMAGELAPGLPWGAISLGLLALLALSIWPYRARLTALARAAASEGRLKMVLHDSGCEIWQLDLGTGTLHREAALEQLKLARSEMSLEQFLQGVHPEDRESIHQAMADYLKGRVSLFEAVFRVESGEAGYLWVQSRGRASLRDAGGRILRLSGTTIDIDVLKRKEAALAELSSTLTDHILELEAARRELGALEERRKLALWGSGCEFFEVDLQAGRLYRENRTPGLAANAIGDDLAAYWAYMHPEDLDAFNGAFLAHVKGHSDCYDVSYRTRREDGGWTWMQTRGRAVEHDADGRVIRIAGTNYDISALKEQERALTQLTATLEHRVEERTAELSSTLDRLRLTQDQLVQNEKLASLGSLVAGIAHEINTPVGIAVTAASLLEEQSVRLSQAVRDGQLRRSELLDMARRSGEAAELVQNNLRRAAELIRSFKQVAVDQSSEERREIELYEYLRDTLRSLAPRLRGLPVTVEVRGPVGLMLMTCPGAIYQVASNLVLNALTHAFPEGSGGRITLEFEVEAGERVCLRVRDDGIGMEEDTRRRAFDPFFTTRRGRGGSGLGLHIVYNLVTGLLGGTITLDSAPGAGSCFTIRIPCPLRRIGGSSTPMDVGLDGGTTPTAAG